MRGFIILVAVALTAGQQFQSRGQFNTAVRLAGQGFFQGGSRTFPSSFDNNNSYNNNNNNNNNNNQQQGSAFFSNANTLQSQNTRNFQNNNQFQSRNTAFQQSRLNSFDANSRNQKTSFSSGSFQGQNRDQFQSSQLARSSPQFNNEVRFESSSNQQNSRNQFQTRNRLTPVSIQLTPSNSFQTIQQTSGTAFQTTRNQQNNQFKQSNDNRQRFVSNSQANLNIQVSSGSRFQSSKNSVNNFNNDATEGVFEPLNLPSGASRLLGSIDTSFSCVDRPYGYYADQENSCRLFHVCNPSLFSDGEIQTYQYSFMCGEGTIFDQNELTCKREFEATPCQEASKFYFRNEQFGRQEGRSF